MSQSQPIDMIKGKGYNLVQFKRDLKAMFGSNKGYVRLHSRDGNLAPMDYMWTGKSFVRIWDKKVVDGTVTPRSAG